VDALRLLDPIEEIRFRVGAVERGERLDRIVARRAAWASRNSAARWIREGRVSVGGAVELRPARGLAPGAEVRVLAPKSRRDLDAPIDDLLELPLVHRGDGWLAVEKPAGLACHPGGGVIKRTLLTALGLRFAAECEPGGPWLPHRLDRETAGLQIAALRREVLVRFAAAFARASVRRLYRARVRGPMTGSPDWIELRFALRDAGHRPRRFAVDPRGQPAHTRLLVLGASERASAVRLEAVTGRQHQLRVHLAHLGHPICGDPIYDPLAQPGERMALLADELRIPGPVAGSPGELRLRAAPSHEPGLDPGS
jgi:23S rRNA pseudouridine1911/1915/1917 synthase